MEVRQLRMDALGGQVSVDDLVDIIEEQAEAKRRLEKELERLKERLAQYEPEVRSESSPGAAGAASDFSTTAENKRRSHQRRKKSPGRRPTKNKFADAERTEEIYPDGVERSQCRLLRERAVWRLENGRAVLVGYRLFGGPGGEPRIPGVTPRCEYGVEILVVLAFLAHVIGISLHKSCKVLGFFCQLTLSPSQADALLRQLAKHWDEEFDHLCDLLVHASVVYMDETGWKIGKEGCSLWAFATELQRVFVFGCRKDAETLDAMLPPELFDGVGVSDDAAVYRERFAQGQKCWAHLLRKVIRLTLLYPRQKRYRHFLDRLLAIYRDAKRAAEDGRLNDEGRKSRVAELEGRLATLCRPYLRETTVEMKPPERDFTNLVNELSRLLMSEELFTFVLVEGVDPTNNLSERILRNPALDRKTGRTSKTEAGARRRSILVSVLESLRVNLATFTLASVLEEVKNWMSEGISRFAKQLRERLTDTTEPVPVPNTG